MLTEKTLMQAKICDTEDRISILPDGILTCIISFLTTKEAIKTSILSTRWKSIWTYNPKLLVDLHYFCLKGENYFRDANSKLMPRFLNFVDRALMGDSAHFLEKVVISGCFDCCHIESWISAAIKRKVRELVLLWHYDQPPYVFHQSLFSCNSLVVLKLTLKLVLNFPVASTCFPNLVLELCLILFKDDNSAQNLISGCPILEDLILRGYGSSNLITLNVTSRSLKRLSLGFVYSQDGVQNIVIDAPSLESLDIRGGVKHDYVVRDMSSIIKAELDDIVFRNAILVGDKTCFLENLITAISRVKFLRLSLPTILPLSRAKSYKLPIFLNLKHLEFFNLYHKDLKWKVVMEFLKKSPVLEALVFEGFEFSGEEHGTSSQWDVPSCLHSHVKTIEIIVDNWNDDVEKVCYFLKNTKVLEKMTIQTHSNEAFTNIKINSDDLLKQRRGSMVCSNGTSVISFV